MSVAYLAAPHPHGWGLVLDVAWCVLALVACVYACIVLWRTRA